jgi:hypothetical protein
MRKGLWAVFVLAGAFALAGVLLSARTARAEIDVDVDEDVRALPSPRLHSAR